MEIDWSFFLTVGRFHEQIKAVIVVKGLQIIDDKHLAAEFGIGLFEVLLDSFRLGKNVRIFEF